MKKIWFYLRHHLQEDFDKKQYLFTLAFLVICLSLNYTFDFEDDYLETMDGYPKFIAYFFFYGFPYFTATLIYAVAKNKLAIFSTTGFWIRSLFAIIVLSFDSSAPFLTTLVYGYLPPEIHLWAWKVSINAMSLLTVLLPVVVFYYWQDRHEQHVYGLNARQFDVRPYFLMLLIMLPFLFAASFNPTFQRQYPMYKPSLAHEYLGIPEWMTVAAYEVAYGLDFVTVEYMFRGFLVIGMASVLGRSSVLCMAVVYCVLHFGKPAGEAISSIFGGYILGVVAYETRSVWGGVIVHMGIAWTMEALAFIQKSFFN